MVLEVHRALQHNGNADVQELRKKESELRRQLQVGMPPPPPLLSPLRLQACEFAGAASSAGQQQAG